MAKKVGRSRIKKSADRLKLLPGEQLLIARRRRALSQKRAAELCGVQLSMFKEMESSSQPVQFGLKPLQSGGIGKLAPHERCMLHRRRAKLSQQEVAELLGCCRHWVVLMERGKAPCEELIKHWEG